MPALSISLHLTFMSALKAIFFYTLLHFQGKMSLQITLETPIHFKEELLVFETHFYFPESLMPVFKQHRPAF